MSVSRMNFEARNSFRFKARIGQSASVLTQNQARLKSSGLKSALLRFRCARLCHCEKTLSAERRNGGQAAVKRQSENFPIAREQACRHHRALYLFTVLPTLVAQTCSL